MRNSTHSRLKSLLVAVVALIAVALDAHAGSTYYAFYTKVVSYPTGKGQVYATADYDKTPAANEYVDTMSLKNVAASSGGFGTCYCYAKPATGYLLAGYSKATPIYNIYEEFTGYQSNDSIVATDNPASLSIISSSTDNPTGDENTRSDSTYVWSLMPEDPNNFYYALFTKVVAECANGQSSLGSVKLDKVCNDLNDIVTITATPADERCHFDRWTLGGKKVSTEASIKVTVSDTARYVAHFTCDSAEIVNFPETGGYMYWSKADTSTQISSNVSTIMFLSDSVALNAADGNNYINEMVGGYNLSAGNSFIVYGKGEATFINTPDEYPYPYENSLNRWSGDKGVCVDTLATTCAYYSFNESMRTLELLPAHSVVAPSKVYVALPDSSFETTAPALIYSSKKAAIDAAGIENVKEISVKGLGKVYTISGVEVAAPEQDKLYIIDGKKVIYRKK